MNPFAVILLGGFVFSIAAPALFTLSMALVEQAHTSERSARETDKPDKKVPCRGEYFVSARDGKTVYVDKRGRECDF